MGKYGTVLLLFFLTANAKEQNNICEKEFNLKKIMPTDWRYPSIVISYEEHEKLKRLNNKNPNPKIDPNLKP